MVPSHGIQSLVLVIAPQKAGHWIQEMGVCHPARGHDRRLLSKVKVNIDQYIYIYIYIYINIYIYQYILINIDQYRSIYIPA